MSRLSHEAVGTLDDGHWAKLEAQAILPRIHAKLSGHQGPLEMITLSCPLASMIIACMWFTNRTHIPKNK